MTKHDYEVPRLCSGWLWRWGSCVFGIRHYFVIRASSSFAACDPSPLTAV